MSQCRFITSQMPTSYVLVYQVGKAPLITVKQTKCLQNREATATIKVSMILCLLNDTQI